MSRNSGLKWMAYAAVATWIWIALFACATTSTTNQAIVESMAEKAGIICYTYLPTHRTEISTLCALSHTISPDMDPATVQTVLQEQIATLWVAGGDVGAWLVSTTLNDLVRFSGLKDKAANSESVQRWMSAIDAFCAGVETASQ